MDTSTVQSDHGSLYDSAAFQNVGKQIADAAKIAKAAADESPSVSSDIVEAIIRGAVNVDAPLPKRTVRLFVSSTFTDTAHVRNVLMEHGYPLISHACNVFNWSFQTVDMRWGVRKSTDDDHSTWAMCMKEIQRCLDVSAGPSFLVILGDKYGYRPFPRRIERGLFEQLRARAQEMGLPCNKLQTSSDETTTTTTGRWWTLDENAVPSEYVLANKSALLPNILSADPELQASANAAWWSAFEEMQSAMFTAAALMHADGQLDRETADQFRISITHAESIVGIVRNRNRNSNALLFRRKFATPVVPSDDGAAAYTDIASDDHVTAAVTTATELLADLKNSTLPASLSAKRVHDVTAPPWTAGGLNPDGNPTHRDHVQHMALEIMRAIGESVVANFKAQPRSPDDVYDEALHHVTLRASKSRMFVGRSALLASIATYISSESANPLVVHGRSGAGKTALVASAAMAAAKSLPGAVHVVRFLGTSAGSTAAVDLLRSLCLQIARAYGGDEGAVPTESKELGPFFRISLEYARMSKPLVIFLDSLDQLLSQVDPDLSWVPTSLPAHVRLVVSVLPDQGSAYAALRSRTDLPNDHYIEVHPLDATEVPELFDALLESSHRRLTSEQRAAVLLSTDNWLPLYVKLAAEHSRQWSSAAPPRMFPSTVREMIRGLFERLEERHGVVLVSHALGYLTASGGGLSISEIDDVLSLDDAVLNDVFEWWDPPMRRLPPSLWLRIARDIDEFLIERGVDGGATVTSWYHNHFAEAARERYLKGSNTSSGGESIAVSCALTLTEAHTALAEYFSGKWVSVPKPYTDRHGREGKADRRVTDHRAWTFQGSVWSSSPALNRRRIERLVFHLLRANQWDSPLLPSILCDLGYVYAKLRSGSLLKLLDEEYNRVAETAPDDWPWRSDVEAFQKFVAKRAHALGETPRVLLQDAYNEHEASPVFFAAARLLASGDIPGDAVAGGAPPYLKCLSKSQEEDRCRMVLEGQLDSMWAAHSAPGRALATSGFLEAGIYVWDLRTGAKMRTFGSGKVHVIAFSFSPDGTLLAFGDVDNVVCVVDVRRGNVLHRLRGLAMTVLKVAFSSNGTELMGIDGPNTLLAERDDIHMTSTVIVWSIVTGAALRTVNTFATTLCGADVSCDFGVIAYAPTDLRRKDLQGYPIQIFDANSGKLIMSLAGSGKRERSKTLAFSPTDACRLVSASRSSIRGWNLLSPDAPLFEVDLAGFGFPEIHSLFWSPIGDAVYMSRTCGTKETGVLQGINGWDATTGIARGIEVGVPCKDRVLLVLFDAAGNPQYALESENQDETKRLWDIRVGNNKAPPLAETGGVEGATPPRPHHKSHVSRLIVAPNSKTVASACHRQESPCYLWDVETGAYLRTILHPKSKTKGGEDGLPKPASLSELAYSPCSMRLVTASDWELNARVWDVATGALSCAPLNHGGQVTSLCVDGAHIVTGCLGSSKSPGRIRVWDAVTGDARNDVTPGISEGAVNVWIVGLTLHADGQRVACATAQGWVQVFDVTTGTATTEVLRMPHDKNLPSAFRLAFSSDNSNGSERLYVTGSSLDWPVRSVDLSTGAWREEERVPRAVAEMFGERCWSAELGVHLTVEYAEQRLHVVMDTDCDARDVSPDGCGSAPVHVASLMNAVDITTAKLCAHANGQVSLIVGERVGRVHIFRLILPNADAARRWVAAGISRQSQEQELWVTCCRAVEGWLADHLTTAGDDVTQSTAWERTRDVWLHASSKEEGSRARLREAWLREAQAATSSPDDTIAVTKATVARLVRQTESKLFRRCAFETQIAIPYENGMAAGAAASEEDSYERGGWVRCEELWQKKVKDLRRSTGDKSFGPLDVEENWGKRKRELALWLQGMDESAGDVLARLNSYCARIVTYHRVVVTGIHAWLASNAARLGVSLAPASPHEEKFGSVFGSRRTGWQGAFDRWTEKTRHSPGKGSRQGRELLWTVSTTHNGDEAAALYELRQTQAELRGAFDLHDAEGVAMEAIYAGNIRPAIREWIAAGIAASTAAAAEGVSDSSWTDAQMKFEGKKGEYTDATDYYTRARWMKLLEIADGVPEGEALAVAVAEAISVAQQHLRSECGLWDDEARHLHTPFLHLVSEHVRKWLDSHKSAAEDRHVALYETALEQWGTCEWSHVTECPQRQRRLWQEWVKTGGHVLPHKLILNARKNLVEAHQLPAKYDVD